MKTIYLILVIILSVSCCAQNNTETISINYNASTRGNSLKIYVSNRLISYKSEESEKQLKLTKKEWNKLIKILNAIDLAKVHSFTPPSNNSAVDAAMQANLSIKIKGSIYDSQTFDHKNPPQELKLLLDEIFKLIQLD